MSIILALVGIYVAWKLVQLACSFPIEVICTVVFAGFIIQAIT